MQQWQIIPKRVKNPSHKPHLSFNSFFELQEIGFKWGFYVLVDSIDGHFIFRQINVRLFVTPFFRRFRVALIDVNCGQWLFRLVNITFFVQKFVGDFISFFLEIGQKLDFSDILQFASNFYTILRFVKKCNLWFFIHRKIRSFICCTINFPFEKQFFWYLVEI